MGAAKVHNDTITESYVDEDHVPEAVGYTFARIVHDPAPTMMDRFRARNGETVELPATQVDLADDVYETPDEARDALAEHVQGPGEWRVLALVPVDL